MRRNRITKLASFRTLRVVTFVAAVLLAACGPTREPTTPPEPAQTLEARETLAAAEATADAMGEPGTLRVGTTYIWDTANPAIGWYNYPLRHLLYDTLVEEAGISDLIPGLAESWQVSDDGLVWIFKIREGVRFHDGTPMTADDVAWSLNWTSENEIETFGSHLDSFAEITALDPTTLQVTLSNPVGNLEHVLSQVWILPRSVWGGMSRDQILGFEDLSAGIGTGPYKLVDWVEGEYLSIEANEDYWRGAPAIGQVVWHEYATADAMVQALLDGEIDVVSELPRTAVAMLEDAEEIEVLALPSTTINELIINSHEKGTQPATLNDPAVRLAMAHAIDKQQIIAEAFLGYAEPATVIIPTSMGDWHNDDVQDIPLDLDEANRILDTAGYIDTDGDGIREDKDGNLLRYRLYGADDAPQVRVLEIVSDGLAQIGISAPAIPVNPDGLVTLYPEYDFDLILWGWSLGTDPDLAMRIFTCDQRQQEGWNDSGYCNEEFDEMYTQQATTVDHEARRALIWQMQESLFNERPYIVLDYEQWLQAYRSDRFTGFGLAAGDILWKSALLRARPVE